MMRRHQEQRGGGRADQQHEGDQQKMPTAIDAATLGGAKEAFLRDEVVP